MRLFNVLSFLILFCSSSIAQFYDDFSDGNFTVNPLWQGQDSLFFVNPSGELQLNDSSVISDEAYLSHSSLSLNYMDSIVWRFRIKLLFDNPSSTNQPRFYLMADNLDLRDPLNGYYIAIGESGTDDKIKLYRQSGTNSSLVCSGLNTFSENVNVNLKIKRDSVGNWEIFSDTSLSLSNYNLEAIGFDNVFDNSSCFGVYCKYTSTRSTKYVFDDVFVDGSILVDSVPPNISNYSFKCSNILEISFNEPVTVSAENILNYYSLETGLNPLEIENNEDMYSLSFYNNSFAGDTITLLLNNIEDFSSNVLSDTFYFVVPDTAENVLVADNFCDGDFLNNPNWYGDDSLFFINSDGALQLFDTAGVSNQSYLVTNTGLLDFSDSLVWTFEVKLLFNNPSSANQPRIYLSSDNSNLKESLNGYFISIGETGDLDKINLYRQDGFSTEKICSGLSIQSNNVNTLIKVTRDIAGNWLLESDSTLSGLNFSYEGGCSDNNHIISMYSGFSCKYTSSNGQNYIIDNFIIYGHSNFDSVAPKIINAKVFEKNELIVQFSEIVNSTAEQNSSYKLLQTNQVPTEVERTELGYVLSFDNYFIGGDTLKLCILSIEDLSLNIVDDTINIVVPDTATLGNLLFNEILYDPFSGGSEYVEIYNNSDKSFDLNGYFLAKLDEDADIIISYEYIDSSCWIHPGELLVFTKEPEIVTREYFTSDPSRFIELRDISRTYFTNTEETIFLLNPDSVIIDELNYSDEMHFELIDDPSGIALEKINPTANSTEKMIWHSASENSGWGTPGLENSQIFSFSSSGLEFQVETKVFSPDSDGIDDIAIFSYNLSDVGFTGSIFIFDIDGRIIKNVLSDELLGNKGTATWDGSNEEGQKAAIGIYLVLFEYFNAKGEVFSVKKTITLKSRF